MAQAGFCSGCGDNVWLNADGSCSKGHAAACVSGAYEAPQPQPVPLAPQRRSRAGLVLGIAAGLVAALFLCGILSAIAVPVFLNASSNAAEKSCFANQRTVEGASDTYLIENDGTALPSDWTGLMSVLVPKYIKAVPECPSGGVYSATTTADGLIEVTCSIHGQAPGSTIP